MARKGGYLLPTVIDPPDTVCVQINIPNDRFHIAAFWGQIELLARWYTWERDDAHTGKDVAAVWREVFTQARQYWEDCNMACPGGGEQTKVRQNTTNPEKLEVSYDGEETWLVWADLGPLHHDQTLVRQSTITPEKLEVSYDGGDTWGPYADLGLATFPQLDWRQNPDNPCKLEYTRDDGETWVVFAELGLCGGFEPPEPPPETNDPQCAAAYAAATEIATVVLDIVNRPAALPTGTFADFPLFCAEVFTAYPGYFDKHQALQMFLGLLSHSGPNHDYAPVKDAYLPDCIAELACGAYCAILNTEPPYVPWTQQAWAASHLDEQGELELIDPARAAARELLDVCVWWLNLGAWTIDQWSLYLTIWSQEEDAPFDCGGCGCIEGSELGRLYEVTAYHWLGTWSEGWGAEPPTYLGDGWDVNDFHPTGSSQYDYRRSAQIRIECPYGRITRVEVDVETLQLGGNPQGLRVWTITRQGSDVQIGDRLDLQQGIQTFVWEGDVWTLDSLRVFYIVDAQTTPGALTGDGHILGVRVWYEPTSLSDEIPQGLQVDTTETPGCVLYSPFPQVYKCVPEYHEGGVGVWWYSLSTSGTQCFDYRLAPAWSEEVSPGDTSQSRVVKCDGSIATANFSGTHYPETSLQHFRMREENQQTFWLLMSDRGNEP